MVKENKPKSQYPVELIRWVDSCSYYDQSWHQISDHNSSLGDCYTVGFVVHENDDSLTLALSITSNGSMCGDMTIPKIAITERSKIA